MDNVIDNEIAKGENEVAEGTPREKKSEETSMPPFRHKIGVSNHVVRRWNRRVSRLFPRQIRWEAERAFNDAIPVPPEWKVPMPRKDCLYYRYSAYVLIFAPNPRIDGRESWTLISVIGPLSAFRPWKPGRKD